MCRPSSRALACRERYENSASFLALFAPEFQTKYCSGRLLPACYTGKAPSLTVLTEAFGETTTDLWLGAQLRDVANFSGARDKLSGEQYEQIAEVIKAVYGGMKVTELMHFFLQFKAGRYGRFYGSIDGLTITTALQEFKSECMRLRNRYYDEEERRRKEEEDARHEELCRRESQWLADHNLTMTDSWEFARRGLTDLEQMDAWLQRIGYSKDTRRPLREFCLERGI